MKLQRRVTGGFLAFLGFMLSPLSWWNDLFINIPLAVGFGWIVSLAHRALFEPAVVVGYWLTNVLGLILLHKGARAAVSSEAPRPYTRRDLLKDVLVSLIYTGLIVVLVHWKILQPVTDYFKGAR